MQTDVHGEKEREMLKNKWLNVIERLLVCTVVYNIQQKICGRLYFDIINKHSINYTYFVNYSSTKRPFQKPDKNIYH